MRFSIILFSIFLFTACKKDKNEEPVKNKITLNTEEGCSFEVSTAGKAENLSGTSVILGSGQLSNQSFYRQYNISTSNGTLNLRFSFPSSMIGKVDANLFKEHTFYEFPLKLEDSGYIEGVVPELFFSSGSLFSQNNATGKVNIKSNESINETNYSIYGEVEFSLLGKDAKTYFVKGYFWKKTL